jgi:1-acyl-sn-glycerol-3-phosphate acyltransferase
MFLYGTISLLVKRPATQVERAEWLHVFAGKMMRTMKISTRLEGRFPERGAVISNHMGYLDIMTYAMLHRVVFVSKSELAQVPLLGWMTTMSGTVYVERGKGGSAERARSGIQATAEAGIPIVFFPEGTTTDGSLVLPFHGGLLAHMRHAGQPVTPAWVSYRFTEDNDPEVTLGDDVCYWGDEVQLFPHIFNLVGLRGIEVTIHLADAPIHFTTEIEDRKEAAAEARTAVMELGGVTEAVTAV